MVKKPTQKDLLLHAYSVLYKNWPKITERLGIREDSFQKPDIKIPTQCTEYDDGFLRIKYSNVLKAYNNKRLKRNGLEVNYKDVLEDESSSP